MSDPIYHLVTSVEWGSAAAKGVYEPASLRAEGFIHFSTAEQVPATSLRYYADAVELLLATVAVERVGGDLRWEDLAGTGVFPHLYGPLPLDAVLDVRPYVPGQPVTGET